MGKMIDLFEQQEDQTPTLSATALVAIQCHIAKAKLESLTPRLNLKDEQAEVFAMVLQAGIEAAEAVLTNNLSAEEALDAFESLARQYNLLDPRLI